jgi:hypothetical protein
MASKMIGRATCPECGFQSAHVKESEKCLYRYCPECGSQHYAKSVRQREDLMGKTRVNATTTATGSEAPAKAWPVAAPEPAATATGTDTTEPVAPPKRRGLFS